MAPELKRRITDTLTQEIETYYYYKISNDEGEVMRRKWRGDNPIKFGRHHVVCDTFPDMVSNNTWNYYKPYWEGNDTTCGGRGRPNFSPVWELESVYDQSDEKDQYFLRIPYSSTPPVACRGVMSFDPDEWKMFRTRFGSLATLPPDWRLNLNFQNHVPCENIKPATTESYNLLHERGGSLKVEDISLGDSHVYCRETNDITALDVELLYHFPPTITTVTQGWRPTGNRVDPLQWKRIITIEGFADVFESPSWDRQTFPTDSMSIWNPPSDLLFELHTTCAIRANDRLSGYSPEIFHINWMDLRKLPGNGPLPPFVHKSWQREQLESRELSLGVVSGSLQYFRAHNGILGDGGRSWKWWTLLILTPRGMSHGPFGSAGGLWMTTATQIYEFMEKASVSWVELADEFEKLLIQGDAKEIWLDEKFSQSRQLFWMLNKIEQIIPMITDVTVQWDWFRNSNKLESLTDDDYFDAWDSVGNIVFNDDQKSNLQTQFSEIREILKRLGDSKLRFEAIRERARSLRDGIFSLTGVKEARDARVLGENVKLLTYVTIFYLPLAFCTSLWAINDMFGTGTRGFAIITVVLAVGTYAAVFGLLHPTTQKDAIEAIRKGFSFSWITQKIKRGADDANQNPPLKAGKRKEKEKEGISSGLQTNDATAEPPQQKMPTLFSKFRNRKVKGGEDHEMGNVRAQSDGSNPK
ncbi:hypothetical protein BGZ57DRAFT_351768 [Hyaloscypha finlandica]|nr:hypothetical protein BGZ57DRAFT_351768 [Hyaloscypha finlandica]